MADFKCTIVDPAAVHGGGEVGPFPFDLYARKCLAQGDSWFSIGSIPPGLTTNTLDEMRLSRSTAIVNCARPGKQLAHMADRVSEPQFLRLLAGRLALNWDAILISGGGNDLIDAASVGPSAAPDRRLLLKPEERPAVPGAADYLSSSGWATFERHLDDVFEFLMRKRASGLNRDTAVVLHNYAPIMPRPAPVGLGRGPWLEPAMRSYSIPQPDWFAVASELLRRLDTMLQRWTAAHAAVQLVDTLATAGLTPGAPGDTAVSGDWHNEIHPTRDGYKKLARRWRVVLDALP